MGCDIHGWIEVRPYDWDKKYWNAVFDVDHLTRDYLVFSRMFGVRDYVNAQPIAANRGIPENGMHDEFSDWRAKDLTYWEGDGHSHTWISLQEIIDNESKITEPYQDRINFSRWTMLFNIMKELGKEYGIDNVRLTVWFDN